MVVSLGALFAAGHSPASIAEWTWDQVALAVQGIQLYHLDLASQVIGGKPAVRRPSATSKRDDRRPGETSNDAEVRREMAKLHALMGGARQAERVMSGQADPGAGFFLGPGVAVRIERGGGDPTG
jgi:hypothetical protein